MSGNTFGRLFRLTTYGESHGPALGGVIDGCPAGIPLSEAVIQRDLARRKPGSGLTGTARKEPDAVRLLSGVFEGATTGTPIGFVIENTNQRSRDYEAAKTLLRPGHAEGPIWPSTAAGITGAGRASARVTDRPGGGRRRGPRPCSTRSGSGRGLHVEFGGIAAGSGPGRAADRPFCRPDPDVIPAWEERAKAVMATGDSLGGVVEVVATGVPAGLGEPVFDKLDARLAYALMGVGAVKGVEIGAGFGAARLLGSQNNDPIVTPSESNNAGGILGGIANGQPWWCGRRSSPFRPSPGSSAPRTSPASRTTIVVGGRHDRSAIPRVVPVLRAMVLLTLADLWLLDRGVRCG
jgi:chorismate synthase